MATNPVSLALVAGPLLDDLMAAIEDRTMDSNRLTNMVGRLRAYAIVCKQTDFNEAADAIEELMAALKAALRYIENTEDELGIELDCRFAARAAYLGEKE